jgi:hypothetical protein
MTHNISKKLATVNLCILRYLRSRFSHFYFSCKNYQETAQARIAKVVVLFTRNPTQLVMHFSKFFTIFYLFYKIQPKVKHYLRNKLSSSPLELLIPHKGTPGSQKPPWKELAACSWILGHGGRRLRPKFRRGACWVGWGMGGRWSGAYHGPVWGRSRSGGEPGSGVLRRCPVPAAGATAPVRWLRGGKGERNGEH